MTKIEWTDDVWNPIVGCSRVSEGCRHCYAERMAARLRAMGTRGCQEVVGDDGRWTGKTVLVEEALGAPLRWRKPRRVFVNSMSDLFHESVPDEWIARIFAVMRRCPQHTFQVLTKRPERMKYFVAGCGDIEETGWVTHDGTPPGSFGGTGIIIGDSNRWPLPNVWLGVSVEDQATADARIPLLLDAPAAVRFVSAEPLLGAVDMSAESHNAALCCSHCVPRLDWVIVGGESGPGARPMHPDWVRSIRDQCASAGTAFFFKQWGGMRKQPGPALLDGREHKEWPK